MQYWYAVQVPARHENKLKKYLEKQKQNGAGIGSIVAFKDTLPGYLFLQSDRWPEPFLRGTTSRCRIVGRVSEDEIRILSEAPRPIPFEKGDTVKVTDGPLAGLMGEVKYAGRERSRVAVSFMSESVSLQMDNKYLQLAEGG